MSRIIRALKDRRVRQETLKSVAAGIVCFAVEFFVLALFLYFDKSAGYTSFLEVFKSVNSTKSGGDHTAAVIFGTGIGFVVSFCLNYVLSVFFVFYYGNVGKSKSGFLKFMIFAAIGFAVNTLGQFIGYNLLGLNLWLVKTILVVILFIFNFVMRKHYIFNIRLVADEDDQIVL